MEFKKEVIVRLSKYIFVFLVLYFSYHALIYSPEQVKELDSLGQHIPLAQSIKNGKLFNPPMLNRGLGYYLPIGEIILSFFIMTGIPLGFYNVSALIILYYVCTKIGKLFKLNDNTSYLFALSIISINSLARLIPTQKNDIWQIIFFLWSFYLINKSKTSDKYYVLLGIALGLLIGVKYSGILFALFLILIYFNNIKDKINLRSLFLLSIPILFFGGIWYLRNYFITGNPFFPVSFLGFAGHPEFQVPGGINTLLNRNTFLITLEAYVSEFLILSIVPFIIIKFAKEKLKEINKLNILGIFSASTYLLLPSEFTRVNITSNMRFLIPAMIIFVLAFYINISRKKLFSTLFIIALLNSIAIFSQLHYYPKLIFAWLVGVIIYEVKLLDKIKIL